MSPCAAVATAWVMVTPELFVLIVTFRLFWTWETDLPLNANFTPQVSLPAQVRVPVCLDHVPLVGGVKVLRLTLYRTAADVPWGMSLETTVHEAYVKPPAMRLCLTTHGLMWMVAPAAWSGAGDWAMAGAAMAEAATAVPRPRASLLRMFGTPWVRVAR